MSLPPAPQSMVSTPSFSVQSTSASAASSAAAIGTEDAVGQRDEVALGAHRARQRCVLDSLQRNSDIDRCRMELRMLRRSVTALLVAACVCAAAGCGIKGPLKLPPAKPGVPGTRPAPAPVRMGDEMPDRTVPDVQPDGGK